MVTAKLDKNATGIVNEFKKRMQSDGIEYPTVSEVVRYMKHEIDNLRRFHDEHIKHCTET